MTIRKFLEIMNKSRKFEELNNIIMAIACKIYVPLFDFLFMIHVSGSFHTHIHIFLLSYHIYSLPDKYTEKTTSVSIITTMETNG